MSQVSFTSLQSHPAKQSAHFRLPGLLLLLALLLLPGSALRARASVPKLHVSGTHLVNDAGKTVQLKGVSTHGLAWYPQYVTKESFRTLKSWGCNTVRLALYTQEYNGYCVGGDANAKQLKKLIENGVSYACDLDLYVIIDWHILSDGNPNTYKKQSLAFFKEMAKKYKNCPNVIFEICNEPNGGTSWDTIKSYAKSVIKTIRSQGSNAVVIVGTPTWSQDVDLAAKSPITGYQNIMYALHFYAATHGEYLRTKLENAVAAGLPVFVSEFGISSASGNGTVSTSGGDTWISLLNKHKISYVIWNLSNKNESCALIQSSCSKTSGWKTSELTASGKWYVKKLGGQTESTSKEGWEKTASGYKYRTADGTYLTSTWKTINGKKYYLQKNGERKTGWLTLKGKKYYFSSKGVMQTGWQTIKGKKYYLSSKGVMQTGWQTIKGKKYYFSSKGVMQTGWQTIKGKKYFFEKNGVLTK